MFQMQHMRMFVLCPEGLTWFEAAKHPPVWRGHIPLQAIRRLERVMGSIFLVASEVRYRRGNTHSLKSLMLHAATPAETEKWLAYLQHMVATERRRAAAAAASEPRYSHKVSHSAQPRDSHVPFSEPPPDRRFSSSYHRSPSSVSVGFQPQSSPSARSQAYAASESGHRPRVATHTPKNQGSASSLSRETRPQIRRGPSSVRSKARSKASSVSESLASPSRKRPALMSPTAVQADTRTPVHTSPAQRSALSAETEPDVMLGADGEENLEEALEIVGGSSDWRRGELIGAGSFGKVFLCMNLSNGQLFVSKEVPVMRLEESEVRVSRRRCHAHNLAFATRNH